MKEYGLSAEQIKPIKTGMGYCYATDMITVQGKKVGYMYREQPESGTDSGWRFFSGDESQPYIDDPDHVAIYDVNTICNYDITIARFLDSPIGSTFEKSSDGELQPVI